MPLHPCPECTLIGRLIYQTACNIIKALDIKNNEFSMNEFRTAQKTFLGMYAQHRSDVHKYWKIN